MKKLILKAAIVVATGFVCAVPVSIHWSQQQGPVLSVDRAEAIIGRPGTPRSVAGVARRTTRRTVRVVR